MKNFFFTFAFFAFNIAVSQHLVKYNESSILRDTLKSYLSKVKIKNDNNIKDFILKNPQYTNASNIQFIEDSKPFFYGVDNANSVITLRANLLYSSSLQGFNASGLGFTVGIWDGDKIRSSHQEFGGRVLTFDNVGISTHATHVAGTILASGVNPTRKGFAYQASAQSYDFNNDFVEMDMFASNGFLVSNHSYGLVAGNLSNYVFGNYNTQARDLDLMLNAYPYYSVVKSAGNDRSTNSLNQVALKGGYDLLTGMSCSKNGLTVGAVESVLNYTSPDSVLMSSFSNYGPTDDGRIKPDIVAQGVNVYSCSSTSDTSYISLQGTSMSAPAITGLILLLQDVYNDFNPNNYLKSASIRGLICHSAREAGFLPGPDYEYGFGLADGFSAANIIKNNGVTSLLNEKNLINNDVFNLTFSIGQLQDVNATICWNDPAGLTNGSSMDNRTPRLVNNLDLKIIKDGVTYFPWKLDPNNPIEGATNNSDNNVDNIERVEIFNAQPGIYTIQVNHKGTLQGGSQDYTLIASSTNGITLNNSDFVVDNDFFVYPTPTKEEIRYSNIHNVLVSSISITDISGKQVLFLDQNAITNSINVSNLQSGVYFIKFVSEGKSIVKKFIKE